MTLGYRNFSKFLSRRKVNEGVSPNTADYDGCTPLHLAACENQVDVVKHLIGQVVHLFPKDQWGNTPLDDATRFGNKEIKQLLEHAG